MKRLKEQSAKNIKGYLLYSPISKSHFFRVHDKKDPSNFVDYKITAEDIEILLLSDFNSLVENEDGTKVLDYSSKVLGRKYNKQLKIAKKVMDEDRDLLSKLPKD